MPSEPNPAQLTPDQRQDNAQHYLQRILRVVEDEIHEKFDGEAAEALRQELLERLDSPELGDEIDNRPADEIITDIRRDLDTAGVPGYKHPWKRRTPEDVGTLHARAAGRAPAVQFTTPRLVRDAPALPANDGQAVAALLRGDERQPG